MIAEIGHYALVLALALALIQSTLPIWGARTGDAGLMRIAPSTALAQLAFILLAFAALVHAHVTSDFSVVNVVENSHSQKPLLYKVTGVWGNHEGSMLLWVTILALFGGLVAAFASNLPLSMKATVLAVQAWITAAFLLFILVTSNPFARLARAPIEGQDLNPVLQDIGLAIHPAAALSRLCRLLDHLRLRRRRPDRGPHRCRLGALGAALGADRLDLPHARHRHGLLLGLLRARLGRLVVLGPGRERLADALARRHGAAAFGCGDGEARGAEGLDASSSPSWPSRSRCSAPSWSARAC